MKIIYHTWGNLIQYYYINIKQITLYHYTECIKYRTKATLNLLKINKTTINIVIFNLFNIRHYTKAESFIFKTQIIDYKTLFSPKPLHISNQNETTSRTLRTRTPLTIRQVASVNDYLLRNIKMKLWDYFKVIYVKSFNLSYKNITII